MAWDPDNAAHQALYASLKRDGQFREAVAFADAGKRRLARLAYWLATASPGLRRAHARNYVSGMVLRLIYGHDLQPSAGTSTAAWDEAYQHVEAVLLDGGNHTVADAGEVLDAQYEGWDAP
jgi:hypothetical protein